MAESTNPKAPVQVRKKEQKQKAVQQQAEKPQPKAAKQQANQPQQQPQAKKPQQQKMSFAERRMQKNMERIEKNPEIAQVVTVESPDAKAIADLLTTFDKISVALRRNAGTRSLRENFYPTLDAMEWIAKQMEIVIDHTSTLDIGLRWTENFIRDVEIKKEKAIRHNFPDGFPDTKTEKSFTEEYDLQMEYFKSLFEKITNRVEEDLKEEEKFAASMQKAKANRVAIIEQQISDRRAAKEAAAKEAAAAKTPAAQTQKPETVEA